MTVNTFETEKSRILPLVKQRQFEEALEILQHLTPAGREQQLEMLELQAVCHFRLGQFDQAAASYSRLAEENPQSAKPLINLGAVYNRMQQYGEAINCLRKAIQRDKANVDAYYNLGFAQRHSGHPDLAIPAYKEAIRLNPKLEQGHLNLANAYLETNNLVMATQHYRQALQLDPELEAAKRGLLRIEEKQTQARQNTNPFGRLVDITQLAHQKSATAIRVLSEGERLKDREETQRLTKGIRNAARHVSEELREKMLPSLLALTRALIDGEQRPDHIADTHERYRQELPRFHEGYRYLKRSVLELRGHEETMNTPDINF